MNVVLTLDGFLADRQGARFADVVHDSRLDFQSWLDFFSDPARQVRMADSETHHDRPALAGVIKELEQHPAFEHFLSGYDGHTTRRGRQAIGVIVRIVMEEMGWTTTGRKGSLGQRASVSPGTSAPGAYRNTQGLSQWFTRAERYRMRS